MPGAAWAEVQTVAPGARSTVVSGRLGPVKSREPVRAASGTLQPGGWEEAWEGKRRFFSAQSNAGQRCGSSGHKATAYSAGCRFDLGLCVGSSHLGYLQVSWGLAPRGRSDKKHFSSRHATPRG